jgi:plasmid stabilization system protein ParE
LAEAENEIEKARQYLNERSPNLGWRFLDELQVQLDAIAAHPQGFPRVETLPNDQPYRRALLATFRYAVIFEIVEDDVVVLAVAHASRRPNYWLGRG